MTEALVLAGGLGTRLRQVVPGLPKPMAPVAGKPFLEILLNFLALKGFDRVLISIGFMADSISGYFGNTFAGMELTYVIETSPLGTGGAVRLGLTRSTEDHVFIFNGDTFLDLEIDLVEQQWQATKCPIIIGREVIDTGRYGRMTTQGGRLTGFSDLRSDGPGLINAGCYVFKREQLSDFCLNKPFSLEADYLCKLTPDVKIDVFVTGGLFIDIGVPHDYKKAQKLLVGYA